MNTCQIPSSMSDFLPMLRAAVEKAPGMRPFMCDGNPLTCTVAIISVDPGTATPFWSCWSDLKGMDRASWVNAHVGHHDRHVDHSQRILAHFLTQITSRVIELNAHARRGKGAAPLGEYYRTADVLQFMLGVVKPSVILCIGPSAFRVVQDLALPWMPLAVQARDFMDWDRVYEDGLAGQINGGPSALAADPASSAAGAATEWTQVELDYSGAQP